MATAPVAELADPGVAPLPARPPSVALYSMSPQFVRGMESSGWLRWLLDHWGLDFRDVTAKQIAAGALSDTDVLLVPDGYATRDPSFKGDPFGLKDLGPDGQRAIRQWVQGGGRYVGWLDGAVLAAAVGVSSATFENAEDLGISSPGSLVRTAVDTDSPLADGVGPFAFSFWDSRYVMRAHGANAPLRFPDATVGGLLRLRLRRRHRGARRLGRRRRRARRERADRGVRLRAELPRVHRRHAARAAQRDPRLGSGRGGHRLGARPLGRADRGAPRRRVRCAPRTRPRGSLSRRAVSGPPGACYGAPVCATASCARTAARRC